MPVLGKRRRLRQAMRNMPAADKKIVQKAMDKGVNASVLLVLIQQFMGPLLKTLIERLLKEWVSDAELENEDDGDDDGEE